MKQTWKSLYLRFSPILQPWSFLFGLRKARRLFVCVCWAISFPGTLTWRVLRTSLKQRARRACYWANLLHEDSAWHQGWASGFHLLPGRSRARALFHLLEAVCGIHISGVVRLRYKPFIPWMSMWPFALRNYLLSVERSWGIHKNVQKMETVPIPLNCWAEWQRSEVTCAPRKLLLSESCGNLSFPSSRVTLNKLLGLFVY